MAKFIIKSNYEYEIEAEDKQHAIEKWHETIEDNLPENNTTLLITLCDSLYAKEVKEMTRRQYRKFVLG